MKMTIADAAWIQSELLNANIDDFTPFGILDIYESRSDYDKMIAWQRVVDFMCRLSRCGIIEILNESYFSIIGVENFDGYVNLLSQCSPFPPLLENNCLRYWMDPLFSGTEKLSALVAEFGVDSLPKGEVSIPFMEALERLFVEHGVPWSDAPLLPVGGG